MRVYYPRLTVDPHQALMIHAKLMVIDDDFLRVGSSNLSNRSMGLDSECDLAIADDEDDEDLRRAIVRLRNQLLAEHLDTDVNRVTDTIEKTGSIIRTVEALGGKERSLVPLGGEVPPEVDEWVPESELLDPEKPVEPDELFDYVVSPDDQPFAYRHLLKVILLIIGVLLLAALWRWTPMGEWIDIESATVAGEWIRSQPMTPVLVIAVYVIGGFMAFPVTLQEVAFDTSGPLNILDNLAQSTGTTAIPGPTLVEEKGLYGNALLTRILPLSIERMDISVPGREARGAIKVLLEVNGQTVEIVATHLGLRTKERRYQFRRLLPLFEPRKTAVSILLGDFNE